MQVLGLVMSTNFDLSPQVVFNVFTFNSYDCRVFLAIYIKVGVDDTCPN